MAEFTFNGISSANFGLRIKNNIILPSSQRDFEFNEVPGVDGDVVVSNNRLKAVDVPFPCRLSAINGYSLFAMKDAINEWLCADEKFHDLIFSDDSSYIYKALYLGGSDVERITSFAGNIELSFRVHPWKYKASGMQEITLSGSQLVLNNTTAFESLPLMKIVASGNVSVIFTQASSVYTMQLAVLESDEEVIIDCDTEEVYAGDSNRSSHVLTYPFPSLKPGQTTITLTGDVDSFKITPRWRMKI